MEIALIGCLALFGNELAKNGKSSRTSSNVLNTKSLNTYPIKSDKKPIQPEDVYKQNPLCKPQCTKPRRPEPYYRSERSQHSNELQTQSRMEGFTGTDSLSYQRKCENEPLFKPVPQNIHGTQVNNDSERLKRFETSSLLNNVLPFEQQKVGPGLNSGCDVQAKGGFHQYYRVMPDHINSQTKETFHGRINPGKGQNMDREQLPSIDTQAPPKFYEESRRPLQATRTSVNAVVQRPDQGYICNSGREQGNDFSFVAPVNEGLQVQYESQTRNKDRTLSNNVVNLSAPGTAGYSRGDYLSHETEREQQCGQVSNIGSGINGNIVHSINGPGQTIRETTESNNHSGQVGRSDVQGVNTRNNQNAIQTHRTSTNSQYTGPSGHYIKGSESYKYNVNSTQREKMNSDYSGPAMSANKGDLRHSEASCQYYKREEVQHEYTPGGGRMNLRQDARNIVSNMESKPDCNKQTVNHAQVRNTTNYGHGHIEHKPRLSIHQRNDFNLAKDQLGDNPYAIRVN
tara:strand:- start:37 stop:1575 length:1539 start_codon:yes stop_codon:yes gene_type:complete